MYSIDITESAKKFLKKIPKQDVGIILNKIYSLKDDPIRYLKRLKGYKLWRLRVLRYRVIIDVVVSGRKIIVLRIGFRKDIYERM